MVKQLPKVGDLATTVSRVDNVGYCVRIVRVLGDVDNHVEVRVIGFVQPDQWHQFGDMWITKAENVTLSA